LAQLCIKLFSGWGFEPDPTGELRALPIPLAGKGRGKERKGGKRTAGKEGKGEVDP